MLSRLSEYPIDVLLFSWLVHLSPWHKINHVNSASYLEGILQLRQIVYECRQHSRQQGPMSAATRLTSSGCLSPRYVKDEGHARSVWEPDRRSVRERLYREV